MARALRHRFVAGITDTVKLLALTGLLFATLGTHLREDLRATFELALVGLALLSTIILLAHNKREEATLALWFGAVGAFLVSGDIAETVARVLCVAFGFVCLWLTWYIRPVTAEDAASA